MFEFFKKKPVKPRVVENIGPDIPKVKIRGVIDSYRLNGKYNSDGMEEVEMVLTVGRDFVHSIVNRQMQMLYPVGTEVYLVMEKKK